jgi:hypothetical protein
MYSACNVTKHYFQLELAALIHLKDHGGLITPSADVIFICKKGERVFRNTQRQKLLMQQNLLPKLIVSTLKELIGVKVFESLNQHSLEQEAESNHVLCLIQLILTKYFNIRLYHATNLITSQGQKDTVRSVYTKLILFKNQ